MTELRSFDRVADVYDQTRGLPPDAERAVGDGLAGAFEQVASPARIVEVGVGTGRIAVPLGERGHRVTGMDISPKMLAVLRGKRTDIDVMLAEASRPPLRGSSFDGALFVHILHLVPDAEATVRATIPLVRPGGVLIEARDDRRETVREEADRRINEVVFELSGVDLGGWRRYEEPTDVFTRIATEAGAIVSHERLAEWQSTTRGTVMLERLRRRDYSSAWKIPDEIMPELLDRVRPIIEKICGGLERDVPFERSVSMTVARMP